MDSGLAYLMAPLETLHAGFTVTLEQGCYH